MTFDKEVQNINANSCRKEFNTEVAKQECVSFLENMQKHSIMIEIGFNVVN